ncbi:hypothetical protein A5680_10365 [Mycobacterium sp. E2989]|nr:hypothetical protein A5680_10365 [Mycobacterium sp. E2989]
MCGAGFSARSDAVYCSSACRQKAHRGRSARRTAALRETVRQGRMRRGAAFDASRSLQRSAANSVRRARQQLDRSLELCRTSELRLQERDAIRQAVRQLWPPDSPAERALWPGN